MKKRSFFTGAGVRLMLACGLLFIGASLPEAKAAAPTEPGQTPPSGADAPPSAAVRPRGRAQKAEPTLRVGLAAGQSSASISSDADYVIRDAATGRGLESCAAGTLTTVTVRARQFVINGKAVSAQKLRFLPADARTPRLLSFAGKAYRGELALSLAKDGSITAVNEVGLDDYIGGVISEEMSPSWPGEALKAQAVAARTFAMYSFGVHRESGYDVCASTHCQVYGGVEAETAAGLRAVSATRGEILTYGGKPVYAAFHASSGGMTAGSEEAGGSALPYLKPVRDPQDNAPNRHWQIEVSVKELTAKLRAAGFDTGALKAVELTQLRVGQGAPDRYPSGRVQSVRLIGARQTIAVPGTKLRWMLGLPSTLFDIRLGTLQSSAPNLKGRVELTGKDGESLVFDGEGRGHGVGLSQWGAKGLAEKKSGYRDILRHYYTNVETTWLF